MTSGIENFLLITHFPFLASNTLSHPEFLCFLHSFFSLFCFSCFLNKNFKILLKIVLSLFHIHTKKKKKKHRKNIHNLLYLCYMSTSTSLVSEALLDVDLSSLIKSCVGTEVRAKLTGFTARPATGCTPIPCGNGACTTPLPKLIS